MNSNLLVFLSIALPLILSKSHRPHGIDLNSLLDTLKVLAFAFAVGLVLLVVNQNKLLYQPHVQIHEDHHSDTRSVRHNPPGWRSPVDVGFTPKGTGGFRSRREKRPGERSNGAEGSMKEGEMGFRSRRDKRPGERSNGAEGSIKEGEVGAESSIEEVGAEDLRKIVVGAENSIKEVEVGFESRREMRPGERSNGALGAEDSRKTNTPSTADVLVLEEVNLTDICFERVAIPSSQSTVLRGWYLSHPCATTTIIYFHGNAGNVGHRLVILRDLLRNTRCDVLAIDYRGYGDSSGPAPPSEEGLIDDAVATIQWTHDHVVKPATKMGQTRKIIVFGTSLGGACAIGAVHKIPNAQNVIHGCIIENSFTALRDVVVYAIPLLAVVHSILRKPILSSTYLTIDILEEMKDDPKGKGSIPFLYMCGELDTIVPCFHTTKLYEAFGAEKPHCTFRSFPDAGHNDMASMGKDYYDVLDVFLNKHG